MRLYLVRHGAALNTAGRCVGHCDVPLSPAGAEAIARAATAMPARPDRIIASDLDRARSSADVFARHWNLPVAYDTRLREMNFGDWEGVSWSELEQRDNLRLAVWMNDWVRVSTPGGESFQDVVARAGDWFADARAAWHDETVVVVAHAGSMRAILCRWLAAPPDWAFRIRIEPAAVITMDCIESARL